MAKTLYCSFCGCTEHEARKLIAGPSVWICDRCVLICTEALSDSLGTMANVPAKELEELRQAERRLKILDVHLHHLRDAVNLALSCVIEASDTATPQHHQV